MPDATITSTASTFGTISGVFSADQSTISGTISGIVPGTLTGSVGVPGPAGPAGIGLPAGGTSGQFLQKTSGVDYATDWVTVNLTGLATESWVTAGFYPLTGNPSSFLTASALTPYLTSATAASTYQTLAGMSDYLAKAGNLAGLANTGTARTNLGLGSLAVVNDAPSDGSQYARKNAAWEVVTTTPDYITSVSSPLSVTTGNLSIDLSAYAPLASPAFTGNPTAPTATFGDNDTSLATTAFVQSALAGGTAVARNLEVEVRNQSGSTIAAGSIVYISGATGNKPLITLAQANNDANSAQTIGFVKTAIANNGTGFVIVRGELENIDTSALTEGVQLYLSPTVAGSWTTTKPSAPQHLVYVGIVIRSHPNFGTILVAVQNGYELDELHDVAIASKANNNLLAYESSTNLWKNKTYSALGLLTSADAASTYQTLAGMSSYLTTSTAASTYALKTNGELKGNFTLDGTASSPNSDGTILIGSLSSGYSYLYVGAGDIQGRTFSGTASSFQLNGTSGLQLFTSGQGVRFPDTTTQTTAYPGSSGFLLKADNLSGLANTGTARTNLGLGTMATATAADYSTTTAANALYYPLSSNPAGYLTSAPVTSVAGRTGAITLAVADVSGAAPLASPTFTGTPSLPTGTIGVTQTSGNNTTAIATTAFVQQEVPAASTTAAGKVELATRLEVVEPSSSTLAVSPMRALDVLMNPGYVQIAQNNNNVATATVGTGASVFTTSMTRVCIGPNTSVAGSAYYRPQTNGGVGQFFGKGINNASINFSKPFWMSGRSLYDDTFRGDANNTSRITVGKSAFTIGALAQKGIGWQKVGGLATNFFLLAHNGTTLTSVDTNTSLNSLGITGGVPFDWSVYSDGSGNVTMFINNVQVATTSAGPTGYSTGSSVWQEEIDQTASAATRMYFTTFGGHYYHA
jgi:hypothetical protein